MSEVTVSNLFLSALDGKNDSRPPVWFMRQAGRYHSHYQGLRKLHSFMELCKNPELACEVTLGPVRDFGFDAAILFSDLLFPLEAMGMGLTYEEGPKLAWHLRSLGDLDKLVTGPGLASRLSFQADALRLVRNALEPSIGLLGFVGGPLTLFCYAVEGSHAGDLPSAKEGLQDGRFGEFCSRLLDLLSENMALQARAGADAIAIMDTCAGEFKASVFRGEVVPILNELLIRFRQLCPGHPVIYYSKGTGPEHWECLKNSSIQCLGVDWKHEISDILLNFGPASGYDWAIQGNADPRWLLLDPAALAERLDGMFGRIKSLPPSARRNWICGLGHGVLPPTPENNVRLFLRKQREIFG